MCAPHGKEKNVLKLPEKTEQMSSRKRSDNYGCSTWEEPSHHPVVAGASSNNNSCIQKECERFPGGTGGPRYHETTTRRGGVEHLPCRKVFLHIHAENYWEPTEFFHRL